MSQAKLYKVKSIYHVSLSDDDQYDKGEFKIEILEEEGGDILLPMIYRMQFASLPLADSRCSDIEEACYRFFSIVGDGPCQSLAKNSEDAVIDACIVYIQSILKRS